MEQENRSHYRSIISTVSISLQHLLIALPAIISVPVLFGAIVGLNQDEMVRITQVSILLSGVMTLLHGVRFKGVGSAAAMVMGADMAVVAVGVRAASVLNLRTFFGMMLIAAGVAYLVSLLMAKGFKLISPAVVLSTMLIYSISFLPVSLDWFLGGVGSPDYGSTRNILVGAAVLSFTLFLNQYGKGILKFGSIGLGMILGFAISLPLGLIKWTSQSGDWLSLPKFVPYMPTFSFDTVLFVIPIIVVLLIKQLMDLYMYSNQMNLSPEEETELLKNGMQTNAIGYLLTFILGGIPTSAQTQNFGVCSFLQEASKKSVFITGLILIVVGMIPKLSAGLVFIPLPVLGALGLLLIASLFNMSIATAKHFKWSNKGVTVLSLSFLFGLLALFKPDSGVTINQGFRIILESGITMSFLCGILLELVIPEN